ncbi:MAG: hypothetical protein QW728_07140 [Thermoplasmata archaeon]
MPISRAEFDAGEIKNAEIVRLKNTVLEFLKANNDRAFTSQEIKAEISTKYSFIEKMKLSRSDINQVLTLLEDNKQVSSKTIQGKKYYCIDE